MTREFLLHVLLLHLVIRCVVMREYDERNPDYDASRDLDCQTFNHNQSQMTILRMVDSLHCRGGMTFTKFATAYN